jgi:hypothetical protein
MKKSLRCLTIMAAMVVLLPGVGFAKHDSQNWATIESGAGSINSV